MELLRLLLLSAVCARISGSPIGGQEARRDEAGRAGNANRRREPLNFWPGQSPADTVVFQPLPTRGCTTTLSETYGYPCTWDGTETVYPTTTIAYRQVNCNGCDVLHVHKDMYFCPNQRIDTTVRVATPSTYWSTICRPSGSLGRRAEGAVQLPLVTTATVFHKPPPIPTLMPAPVNPAIVSPSSESKPKEAF